MECGFSSPLFSLSLPLSFTLSFLPPYFLLHCMNSSSSSLPPSLSPSLPSLPPSPPSSSLPPSHPPSLPPSLPPTLSSSSSLPPSLFSSPSLLSSLPPSCEQVDNTDAEGRLLLADALCYAKTFDPRATVDLATLTGAIDVALGSGAAAVFTNSAPLWKQLHEVRKCSFVVVTSTLYRVLLYLK